MPLPRRSNNCRGQNLVEYAVVLALVSVLAVTLTKGIGRQAVARVGTVNDALQERGVSVGLPPISLAAGAAGGAATNNAGMQ